MLALQTIYCSQNNDKLLYSMLSGTIMPINKKNNLFITL